MVKILKMKKVLILLVCFSVFVNCKNEKKADETTTIENSERTEKQSDGLTLLKGEFVYYDGAAVLQTHAEIYGVLLINKFEELNKQAQSFKTKPTDPVEVEIRGKITSEKHDKILWPNKVEVVEILNVKLGSKEEKNIIKLGNQ